MSDKQQRNMNTNEENCRNVNNNKGNNGGTGSGSSGSSGERNGGCSKGGQERNASSDMPQRDIRNAIAEFRALTGYDDVPDGELAHLFERGVPVTRVAKAYRRAKSLRMQGSMRFLDEVPEDELVAAAESVFTTESFQLKCRCLHEDSRKIVRWLKAHGYNLAQKQASAYERYSFEELQQLWDTATCYKDIIGKCGVTCYKQAHIVEQKLGLPPLKKNTCTPRNIMDNIPADELKEIVQESWSYREIARKLNVNTGTIVKRYLISHGYDVEHIEHRHIYQTLAKMTENSPLNTERIMNVIVYLRGPQKCERCGCDSHNGKPLHLQIRHINSDHIDNRIENIQVLCPTCHSFVEKRGMRDQNMRTYKKKLMTQSGRKCACCGRIAMENGEPVPLECHHKNGDRSNNHLSNLELLCPNCHAQTTTFCNKKNKGKTTWQRSDEDFLTALMQSRTISEALTKMNLAARMHYYERARRITSEYNIVLINGANFDENGNPRKRKPLAYCPTCGNVMSDGSAMCRECRNKLRKLSIPVTKEELKELIREHSFRDIGRLYSVTDNTVKKWCRRYHLPSKRSDIERFTDGEWAGLEQYESKIEPRQPYDLEEIARKYEQLRNYQQTADCFGCCIDTVVKACKVYQVNIEPLTPQQNVAIIAIDKNDSNNKIVFENIPLAIDWVRTNGLSNGANATIANRLRDVIFYKARDNAFGYYWREATEEEIHNSDIKHVNESN